MRDSRLTSLWRHPDFLKLWAAQTTSVFGSQISVLAIPLVAAVTLESSAADMGILAALSTVPYLLLALVAGVWVDRLRRRPILVAADLGRAFLLLLVPAAALLDVLRIEMLYAIAFLVGLLSLFFDVAYQSFLPSLIGRDRLTEGNSKLQVSQSTALVAGPGLAGVLVQIVAAPAAILVDAFSFLISAYFLGLIRASESRPLPQPERRGMLGEIAEGIRAIRNHSVLRALTVVTGTWNLFANMLTAMFVLYLVRDLAIGPGLLGVIFAGSGVGFLLGAVLANRTAEHFSIGTIIIGAAVIGSLATVAIPLASGPTWLVVSILTAAGVVRGLALMHFDINVLTMRQTLTPDHLLGRVTATTRLAVRGVAPIGALIGGVLGELIGLRATLLVAAVGRLLSILWLWYSPLNTITQRHGVSGSREEAHVLMG